MARVLVIEDEPSIAMILDEVLSNDGHEVARASNGRSGLEKLSRGPAPEIVLLDLHLPVMNGRAVIEAIRSDPKLGRIPVIIITGSIPTPNNLPSEETYQALIPKPFDLDDVVSTVKKLLEKGGESAA